MAKLQYTNIDTAIPSPGDIAVLSTENASAIIGLANSNSLVILGTWIDNPNPGFVGTVENDVVYVNCEVLPNLGDNLYLSAANKGKVTNIAPANAYFIGSVLQVGQQIGSYYQIKTVFNKYGSPLATPSSPGAVPSWPPVVEASLSAKGLTFDMASVDEASQNFEVAFQRSYFNHNPRPDLGMSFGYNTAGAGGEPGLYLEWENYYDNGDGIFMEWYLQALSPGATQAYRPIDVMVKRDLSLIVLSHYCDSVLFYARTAGPTDSPILSVATGLVNFGSIHTSVVPDGTPVYFGGNGDGTNPVVRFRTGSIDDNPQYGFFLSTHYASSHSVAILGTRDGVAGGDITAIKLSNAVVTMPGLAGTGTRHVVVDANGVLSAP